MTAVEGLSIKGTMKLREQRPVSQSVRTQYGWDAPEVLSDRRLKAKLCSRYAACKSCVVRCGYGREWLRRQEHAG